ncbi:MAG: hypothetical protein HOP08_04225 [Cyclobacteriaceae bacterium]|nr:hypothetical protein [Cyclobacteriaceae bacterium]
MRLGQLARKLDLRPIEIVDFLAKQSIQIESGGNTRIEDEHVAMILQKFDPQGLSGKAEEVVEVESVVIEEITPEPVEVIQPLSTISMPEVLKEEKIEVIKAPKVELSGLKVLGKIELPEPKKKEVPATTEEPSPSTDSAPVREPRRENKNSSYQRRERSTPPQRPAKNPIVLQREKEAREEEEKRKANLELEKEKRALHYLKKVNVVRPTKAVKVTEEKEVIKHVVKPPAPKSVWGKFKRWLNT